MTLPSPTITLLNPSSPPGFNSSPAVFASGFARPEMAYSVSPYLPKNRIILGCGGLGLDFLATVVAYPQPDQKIRSTSLKVQGGGNAGNCLTCAARLGLQPRIIAKLADDVQGNNILEELKSDGVDTSFLVVSKGGNSPLTYVIVDQETNTRTCISTPGNPPMSPDDMSQSTLFSALDGVRIVYLDGRLHENAFVIAWEAKQKSIPILIDAEKKREGLDDLLPLADYVVCSASFPQAWTKAPSVPTALVSMLLRLPNLKFVIVTLGENGCLMLERSVTNGAVLEEMDIDVLLKSAKQKMVENGARPICSSSQAAKVRASGVGMVSGRLLVGTAEKIPPSELIDTTGAGDAFIGAVLYALMLSALASVAACLSWLPLDAGGYGRADRDRPPVLVCYICSLSTMLPGEGRIAFAGAKATCSLVEKVG